MIVWLLIASGVVLALGVLLVVFGRRGRKVNDHPQCTWCRADLGGQEKLETCQACGAGLSRAGAVRMGVRKRLSGLIATGIALCASGVLVAVLAIGLLVIPEVILRWVPSTQLVAVPDFPRREAIAKPGTVDRGISPLARELLRRVKAGDAVLVRAKPDVLADRVIREQLRDDAPWDPAWGDIVTELIRAKALDEEQIANSAMAGTRLAFETRAHALKGEVLPIKITVAPSRLGEDFGYRGVVQLQTVRIGGKYVPFGKPERQSMGRGSYRFIHHFSPRQIEVGKSRSWGGFDEVKQPWLVESLAVDFPAGAYDLDLTARIQFGEVYDDESFGSDSGRYTRDVRFRGRIRLVEDRSKAMPIQVLSESQRETLRSELGKTAVQLQRFVLRSKPPVSLALMNIQDLAEISITPPKLPPEFGAVFRVKLLVGDRELVLGKFGSVKLARESFTRGFRGEGLSRTVIAAPLDGVDKVTVIFTPDIEAALSNIGINQVVDEEFRIDNISIEPLKDGSLTVESNGDQHMSVSFKSARSERSHSGGRYDFLKQYGWTRDPPSPFDFD